MTYNIVYPSFGELVNMGRLDDIKAAKTLDEITHIEWMLYEWVEVSHMGKGAREFIRGQRRTPDEAVIAYRDYDRWIIARRAEIAQGQVNEQA